MFDATRNLRTAERYLLAPPLAGSFGATPVALCDISAKGARFRHDRPIEAGTKSRLQVALERSASPVSLEAVIVWSQLDPSSPGRYMSGVRTWGSPEVVEGLLTDLQSSDRTNRIEELRSTDRFYVVPPLAATFDGRPARLADLSARGARIELAESPARGIAGLLTFRVAASGIEVAVAGRVVWASLKAITGQTSRSYHAGLYIDEKPELMRLAIGHLCESSLATLDTSSLRLKLKIMRARARQMAPAFRDVEASGIPAEHYLLVQAVREELRLNPEEALHWYRRARLIINDPKTKVVAPAIASHADALAVWEYLDRSVDPSIVGRAFELPE